MQPCHDEHRTHDFRPARHHHAVRRLGGGRRPGHRAVQEPTPASGASGLPRARGPRLPRTRAASGNGQLHHAQAARDQCLAGSEPPDPCVLRPTSGSWLNLVEVWFGIIERQALRRGTFVSLRNLTTKIKQFIEGWNDRKHPFIWMKNADDVLAKIKRKRISTTNH
jgi:hypothetical protein